MVIHILAHDVTVQKAIVISITFAHIVKIIIIIKTKLIKTLCNTANGYGFSLSKPSVFLLYIFVESLTLEQK